MSSAGLRFTLKVDGIQEMSTAVVSFSLHQKYSIPFTLEVDIASGLFDLTAEDFLEKNAVLTVWQGETPQRYVSGIVTSVQAGRNNGWQMRYWLSI
ncbi:type VI secretion system tip protein VgrG, partial [Salmonella enterica]|nr:type VI secretion system tip protein VgrG [Salmonella enterica]